MSDIFYVYGTSAYANITNKCPCSCNFCIRQNGDSLGSAENLWHEKDPSQQEIFEALKNFPLEKFRELVFCGYGEPTYALDNLITTAKYVKENYSIKTRINTNGLGDLINGREIIPLISPYIDSISISLNAPDADEYETLCHPVFTGAYQAILKFADDCRGNIDEITLSVVDVISEDEIEACRKIAAELNVKFRIRSKD